MSLPSLQPPKGRKPRQVLHLNTTIGTPETTSQVQTQFTADVMASMYPNQAGEGSSSERLSSADSHTSSQREEANKIGMSARDWNELHANHEIEELRELGEGSGGMVRLCRLRHVPHRSYAPRAAGIDVFALKEIPANPDPNLRKQILRELQFNRSCTSPYIVNYYGAFLVDELGQIFIAMEFCDGGSLDAILKQITRKEARIGEKVLACIATSVLEGITYLYSQRIIHRDIKPQNILLTGKGEVKLCDFGVSGEVVDSLVTTFTGTSYYMAPERIRGQPYTVTSDVWSLGLTLMELALNRFPFETSISLTPIELLTQIVNAQPPELQDEQDIKWSASFRHFLKCCLEKDSEKRPPPQKLLSHPWVKGHRNKPFNMKKFVQEVWA